MDGVLRLASDYDCERALIDSLEVMISQDALPDLKRLQAQYLPQAITSTVQVTQHQLSDYDSLLATKDLDHGREETSHV